MNKKKIVIIGAGVAGLAAAVRMAAKGHYVTVCEAGPNAGGKLNTFELDGYRFDAGPSLFTMPQYVDELYTIAGEDPAQFKYQRLDVVCKYWWSDGTQLTTYRDEDRTVKEISSILGEKKESINAHFIDSATKYKLTGKTFLEYSLHKLPTWLTLDVLKALTQLNKLDVMTTMHRVNAKRFNNPKTIQLFDRYATYNGSSPYKAPGLLNIIPHFEYGFGAYIPNEGMYQISNSIYELALRLGVTFHFNTKVTDIIHVDESAKGVMTQDRMQIPSDIVITNMDAYFTYKHLLKKEDKADDVLKQERSSSALIFYWGINRSFPELDLHNILFADNYKAEFDAIDQRQIWHDPTVYINITSKFVPNDAPSGCENWFVMINVPHNSGQDWVALIKEARINIISKINTTLSIDISQHIVCEEVLDPRKIESNTMSYTGSLYGTSSNSKWAAFARHPNESKDIKGLYFLGGSVHPGGGVPLCLLSAKIVDDLINA